MAILPTELHKAQPVAESLLCQSAAVTRGARQGIVLADRPQLGDEADGAGVSTSASACCAVLPVATWRRVIEVSIQSISSTLTVFVFLHFSGKFFCDDSSSHQLRANVSDRRRSLRAISTEHLLRMADRTAPASMMMTMPIAATSYRPSRCCNNSKRSPP